MKRLSQLLSAIMICTVGCSKLAKHDTPSVSKAAVPDGNVLLVSNMAEPEYVDPGLMAGNKEMNLFQAFFEGLTNYAPKGGDLLPGVAKSWEMSPDGLTYTFHLRNDAKWSDGHPVTAHDFVYAWERVLNPKTAAQYAYIMYYVKNAEAYNAGKVTDPAALGVKAVSDDTLLVTLEKPAPFFLQLTAFMTYSPVPKWAVEAYGAKWTLPEHIVTNGPFHLQGWIPYKEIVARKSPTYWDQEKVTLDGIKFFPIEDKETALKMFDAGELHISTEVPIMKAPSLMTRDDFMRAPYFTTYYYEFNTTKPPFNNKKVRQALSMAIDRKALVEQYLHNVHYASSAFVPLGTPGYTSPPGLEFNPTKAKALLAEAGYTDPKTFPQFAIHYNTDDLHKLIAQVVQQEWKKHLGITVTLWNEEWKSYLKTQNMMQHDVTRRGWIGDFVDPENFLNLESSTSSLNHSGWGDATYDSLLAKALVTQEAAARNATYAQAEAILLDAAPVLPLFVRSKMQMVKSSVHGFYPTLMDAHPWKWVSLQGANALANAK